MCALIHLWVLSIPLIICILSQLHLDLKQGDYQWEQPEEVVSPRRSHYVTMGDLEEVVSRVMQQEAHSRQVRAHQHCSTTYPHELTFCECSLLFWGLFLLNFSPIRGMLGLVFNMRSRGSGGVML